MHKAARPAAPFANTINGQACASDTTSQPINPSTRRPLWAVPVATGDDVNAAVAAANAALAAWSQTPWAERASHLNHAREALLRSRDDMADLIMQETGRPVSPACLAAAHIHMYAG
jgi:acyl-CoA reductase-like NAD-dependent aldehyde dehydrogenase